MMHYDCSTVRHLHFSVSRIFNMTIVETESSSSILGLDAIQNLYSEGYNSTTPIVWPEYPV